MHIGQLPPGIFVTLLALWESIRATFGGLFQGFFAGTMNNMVGGTILAALIGPGLVGVLGYWLVKWIVP